MGISFEGLGREMRRQVEGGLRPSIQVAVDWRGEVIFDQAVGSGASPDASYLLWSTTKPFVAVALLQIIEEGKAELTDLVAKHIPEFGMKGKEACTIAHLLSHRGGFPDTGAHMLGLLAVARDWKRALAYVCEMEAQWEPGEARGYHPMSGWFIVGELVQRLRDRPLWETLRARVLDPAGIDADGFCLGRPELLPAPPLPISAQDVPGTPPDAPFWNDPATRAALIPGAGGISRANQVIRFYRALLDGGEGPGGRLLAPETVRLATFPHAIGTIDRFFLFDIPWGLGFHLKHAMPGYADCGSSATPGTFGHGGHFLVNTAWADPGKDLAVCILANGLTPLVDGALAVARLSQAVHDAIDAL